VAVESLVQLMQRKRAGHTEVPQVTLLEGTWIEGATVAQTPVRANRSEVKRPNGSRLLYNKQP